ncbi:MAG: carbon-nitrogen hydrolase family protein, partial [Verrucomicrobiae bacterium]|nr:carbon-nitrogen hydrolase family protein [Verrucomicrobiae bacterium]
MPQKNSNSAGRSPNALRVAAVQLRSVDDLEGNLQKMESILEQCAAKGVQIAAFPECAVTGYTTEAILRPTLRELRTIEKRLSEACRKNRIHALIGTPYRTGKHIYNAALIIDARGKLLARQFKLHLVGQDTAWNCAPGS